MKTTKISFSAVGDMLIQRLIPTDTPAFQEIKEYICRADARFFNLETTLHRGGHYGNQFNGGSFHRSDPKVLDIAKEYGFNMASFANNHTFDYGYGGLESTLDAFNDAGFVHTGVGTNLDEAAAPAYLETYEGRVALISMTASFVNDAALAGRQSRRVPGRPGVNGLRIDERIEVPAAHFAVPQDVAENSGVNAAAAISRAEGYLPLKENHNEVEFGTQKLKFVAGEKLQYHTSCNREDMARLEQSIIEAQAQADCIIVSIHAHQVGGSAKESVPAFLEEFAHRAIDLGAHAVIGHGPHLLRPIEIYKNRPIFYSLGDFFLHNESFNYAPEDFFAKYGLTSDDPLCEVYRRRSRNYTCGLLTDSRMLEAVIPYFEIENGELTCLELLPIELGIDEPRYRIGTPSVCFERGIIERLAEMSRPYGTTISVDEKGHGIVDLENSKPSIEEV